MPNHPNNYIQSLIDRDDQPEPNIDDYLLLEQAHLECEVHRYNLDAYKDTIRKPNKHIAAFMNVPLKELNEFYDSILGIPPDDRANGDDHEDLPDYDITNCPF